MSTLGRTSVDTQPPETDLIIPLPGDGQLWDPHTVHTHYFGFCVPEVARQSRRNPRDGRCTPRL
jgi:hypothetical protein